MAKKIIFEDKRVEKEIELPDGTILAVPERSAETYEKFIEIIQSRENIPEYEYCKRVLELLFGKDGFKKIAPNGKKVNLDRLMRVTNEAIDIFLADKNEFEKEQINKQLEYFAPIAQQISKIAPVIQKKR